MAGHIFKAFDADLVALRDSVVAMSNLARQQLLLARQVLMGGGPDLVQQVEAGKETVDGMQVAIDAACSRFITLRQPCASDLRVILTLGKVINDLDRISKKARKIVRKHQQMSVAVPAEVDLLGQMDHAIRMFDAALLALEQGDKRAAAKIAQEDADLNEAFRTIERQLVTRMMQDPVNIEPLLQVTEIAKAIERVGDHAGNIAEYVVYLVEGLDVRHQSASSIAAVTA